MNNLEFAEKVRNLATGHKTVYLWGTFGAPLNEGLIRQKVKQYPNNYSKNRQANLRSRIGDGLWAFDCVGLIKGILWGWQADRNKSFGGAVYKANGVPDIGADTMAKRTLERSDDFEKITVGEAVYRAGHIGIYLGDGKVGEATLTGAYDGVVITELKEADWAGHGKLPWVEYLPEEPSAPKPEPKEGDRVYFAGGKHYTSSTGNVGYSARAGEARVTRFLPGRKHPYHVIHTDGTSNVYGWVDKETVTLK